jgi:pyruvate-formate lyase-activating enzyme
VLKEAIHELAHVFGLHHCDDWHCVMSFSNSLADADLKGHNFCSRCRGTSISFNEPTLSLEWSLDVFHLARQRGLYNTYVTNGYMTPEALSMLIEAGLDAMNVDVKGDPSAVTLISASKINGIPPTDLSGSQLQASGIA